MSAEEDRDDGPLAVAEDLFDAGRFAEAWPLLEDIVREDEHDALAWFLLGAVIEREGSLRDADAALRRAAALDPDEFVGPLRLSDAEFDAIVEEALADLPAPVRAEVEARCTVLREDFPHAARVRREGADPLLLGECHGEAEGARGGYEGPVQVVLYRRNLEKRSDSLEHLRDEIRVTVYHEIGHALGLDEEGVAAWGLE